MSRGPGRLQRSILGLLDGSAKAHYFANPHGGLTTAELLEELGHAGVTDDARPRKELMAKVLRACASLQDRGLLSGEYVADDVNAGRETVCWKSTASRQAVQSAPTSPTDLAADSRAV